MGSWRRVPRYDRIRSRHIEWNTHRGAKGLVRVNDLNNEYADDNVINVTQDQGVPQEGCPSHAEKVGIQCTGGARESEDVKVKGGKREGG